MSESIEMDNGNKTIRKTSKIGNGLAALLCLVGFVGVTSTWAAPRLNVTVDRNQISEDESVLLKFSVEGDGQFRMGQPKFDAPAFEAVNQYSNSFMRSTWENGHLSTSTTEENTQVLRPLKTGNLTIGSISITVDGEVLKAQPIDVVVTPAGSGSPPPRNYGAAGGTGLRANQRPSGSGVMLKAEIDKSKVYKGEQVIVSYYLYKRTAIENLNITKFPELKGFLREELEMPVIQNRLAMERVVMNGVPYTRALLVRYAAYPVEVGKLRIDPIEMKYNYFTNRGVFLDEEDDPFSQFFQRLMPQAGNTHSDILTVESIPVPEEGKPVSFSGGVGDFEIEWAADKTEVKANEAVTVTVKIEGRGNVAAILEPKPEWPSGVELYDSKVNTKVGKGGVGSKVFEFLLIPRSAGKLDLKPLEFSAFDPIQKKYVTKNTTPLSINVLPGTAKPGETADQKRDSKTNSGSRSADSALSESQFRVIKTIALGVGFLAAFGVLLWSVPALRKKGAQVVEAPSAKKTAVIHVGEWSKVTADTSSKESILKTYDRLCDRIFEELDQKLPGLSSRARSRGELKHLFLEERRGELSISDQHWIEAHWPQIENILEKAELARYATGTTLMGEVQAREELPALIAEAKQIFNS